MTHEIDLSEFIETGRATLKVDRGYDFSSRYYAETDYGRDLRIERISVISNQGTVSEAQRPSNLPVPRPSPERDRLVPRLSAFDCDCAYCQPLEYPRPAFSVMGVRPDESAQLELWK